MSESTGDMLDKCKLRPWKINKTKGYRQEMFIEKENKMKEKMVGITAHKARNLKTSYILP